MNRLAETIDRASSLVDVVSLLAIVGALAIALSCRRDALSRHAWQPIAGILTLLFLHNLSNVLEWLGITVVFDVYEDYFEILLPVLFFFALYVVTEERAVARLQESEERYRALFDNAAEGVLVAEVASRRLSIANPAICAMLGYTERELVGMNVRDIHPADSLGSAQAEFDALARGEKTLVRDIPCRKKDGSIIYADISGREVSIGGVSYSIGMFTDVTEHRAMEDRLRQAEKMEAIGQLAGGVAHDFNNQLGGIVGCANILREELAGDAKRVVLAEQILAAAERARGLTSQLLAFARRGKYRPVVLDIHEIIGEVASILGRSIDKRIVVTLSMEARPATVRGDATQIQNALLNLALNARDAMPTGGELGLSTDSVQLDEESCRAMGAGILAGPYVRICVRDTGIGMDAETKRRLFEPFFTTKAPGKGSGMGLAAVYGTVKAHQGAIDVSSEPGRGATFSMYLPAVDEVVSPAAETPPGMTETRTQSSRILLVDDEPVVCDAATRMLERLGHTVSVCRNGADAVEVYRSTWRDIDVVVLDMVMPVMGGKETFAALKAVNPDVVVLLSTGYTLDGEAQDVLSMGAAEYIQKPFRMAELARKLAAVLRRGDAPRTP